MAARHVTAFGLGERVEWNFFGGSEWVPVRVVGIHLRGQAPPEYDVIVQDSVFVIPVPERGLRPIQRQPAH